MPCRAPTLEDLIGIEHGKLGFFQELRQTIEALKDANAQSEQRRREIAVGEPQLRPLPARGRIGRVEGETRRAVRLAHLADRGLELAESLVGQRGGQARERLAEAGLLREQLGAFG